MALSHTQTAACSKGGGWCQPLDAVGRSPQKRSSKTIQFWMHKWSQVQVCRAIAEFNPVQLEVQPSVMATYRFTFERQRFTCSNPKDLGEKCFSTAIAMAHGSWSVTATHVNTHVNRQEANGPLHAPQKSVQKRQSMYENLFLVVLI